MSAAAALLDAAEAGGQPIQHQAINFCFFCNFTTTTTAAATVVVAVAGAVTGAAAATAAAADLSTGLFVCLLFICIDYSCL